MAKSNTATGSKAAPAKKSSKAAPAAEAPATKSMDEMVADVLALEKDGKINISRRGNGIDANRRHKDALAHLVSTGQIRLADKNSIALFYERVVPEAPRRAVWGRDGRTAIVYKGDSKHSVYTLEPVAPPTGEQERTGYLWMAATNNGEQQTPAVLVKGDPIGDFQAEAFEAVDALWEEQQVELGIFEGREE